MEGLVKDLTGDCMNRVKLTKYSTELSGNDDEDER